MAESKNSSKEESTIVPVRQEPTPARGRARRPPPELLGLLNDFDEIRNRMLSAFWNPFAFPELLFREAVRTPPVDLEDRGNAFEATFEMPGMSKDRIQVRVQGNVLHVDAESSMEKNVDRRNFVYRERGISSYHREITLPEPISSEQVTARFESGVLTVTIPKAPRKASRPVPVG